MATRKNSAGKKATPVVKAKGNVKTSADATKCGNPDCDKLVGVGENAIECWACNIWYHKECSNITSPEFESLVKLENIYWICEHCREADRNDKNEMKELKKIMSTVQDAIREMLNKMNKMEEERTHMKREVKELVKKEVEEAIVEFKEEERRKNNIIVSGLPEISGVKEGEGETSTSEIENLLNYIGTQDPEITHGDILEAFRLGKPREDKKPRIVKVVFKNQEIKKKVVKKAINKNKRERDPNMKVYVNDDLTVKQREEDRILREELKRRRALGEDVMRRGNEIVQRKPGSQTVIQKQN